MGQSAVQVKRCHVWGLVERHTLTQPPEQREYSRSQTLGVLQVLQVIKSFMCNQDVRKEIPVMTVEVQFAACSRAARVFYWRMWADINSCADPGSGFYPTWQLCAEKTLPHTLCCWCQPQQNTRMSNKVKERHGEAK